MSKMKHLLRKLHIGSGGGAGINGDQARIPETPPVTDPSPSSSSSEGRTPGAVESGDRTAANETRGGMDFNFLEEEFQVQLALAISASGSDARNDPESAQIDAAKRISLGCCSSVATPVSDALLHSLSLRYWSYNVVNYNEKLIDGFYDVYEITSNSVIEGKMPLLVDLQAITVSDSVNYEVILVNRLIDPELRELERKAYIMSNGLAPHDSIQKIADIVVDRMGGPVDGADEMSRRWTRRSYELRSALNTITLPLGSLDVGLSRHRALLFKVLADKINLPCMLVKGSYYTGTDDGAVNLIKIGNESEYIIDLMGAPGTLIPAEVPSSLLPSAGFDGRSYCSSVEPPKGSSLERAVIPETLALSAYVHGAPEVVGSKTEEPPLFTGVKTNEQEMNLVEKDQTDQFEREIWKLFPSSHKLHESSSNTGKSSSAEKIKVKNVSKYVISAAKNPQFAQKLHAVLLESGASPPPDLFSDIYSQVVSEQVHPTNGHKLDDRLNIDSVELFPDQSVPCISTETTPDRICGLEHKMSSVRPEEQREFETDTLNSQGSSLLITTSEVFMAFDNKNIEKYQIESANVGGVPVNPPGMLGRSMYENQNQESLFPSTIYSGRSQQDHALGRGCNLETYTESSVGTAGTGVNDEQIASNGYDERINPMLGEVAEWEIPWEDLQIGERIGIGSYGEVYRADWNGTEVAVKKFLDQDFSGDALVQFKYEAELMLRLRHPNVVLFMGAVTRPPHLSILTEFLPRGSLYRLLHRPNHPLDEKRRMRMALDVAKGMNYLHTSHPTIVHRDLKTPNLLVDKNWVVKVCDFGLSRTKHHTFLSSKSTAGTPEWMAPEVLRNEPANEKCDVFSFGVILWELATCDVPWKGMNPMQVVGAVGFQNRRLTIPPETDPAIAQIIEDCWQTEPHLRPSFSQIISRLHCVNRLLIERTHNTNQTERQL